MPLYNLACRQTLPESVRQKVAEAITSSHCEQTGAPAEFVNVVFVDGYPLPAPQSVSVLGGVRTGGNRTPESIARLKKALQQSVAKAMDESIDAVGMSLVGVPSNWIVEGGEIMPEPGSQAEKLMSDKHGL